MNSILEGTETQYKRIIRSVPQTNHTHHALTDAPDDADKDNLFLRSSRSRTYSGSQHDAFPLGHLSCLLSYIEHINRPKGSVLYPSIDHSTSLLHTMKISRED